jgi:hypothetical protein
MRVNPPGEPPRRPTRGQIRRRRRAGLGILAPLTAAIAYLVLATTVFAPVDRHGAELVHLEVHSEAVGEDLGVNVLVPAKVAPPGERPLLVFLHGRGGDEGRSTTPSSAACRACAAARASSSPSPTAATTATGTTAAKGAGTNT